MTTIIKRSLILLLFAMLSLPLMAQQKNKSASDAAADKSLPRAEYSAPINKAVNDFLAAAEKAKAKVAECCKAAEKEADPSLADDAITGNYKNIEDVEILTNLKKQLLAIRK